jgi:hypothetical protein
MDKQIDWASIHVRRIHHNARQVGKDVHWYQQNMAGTDAFFKNIENKGFAFLPVYGDDE